MKIIRSIFGHYAPSATRLSAAPSTQLPAGRLGRMLKLILSLVATAALLVVTPAQAKETFVIDNVQEPSSLDPHLQWNPDSYTVYRNIYDNLVTRNTSGAIAPQVAAEWTIVSETEVDFTLRDDIMFHDGTALTAADVVFSVKRITDPKFKSPQFGQFSKITGAEATGLHSVRLTTNGPYPVLMAQLVKLSIVSKTYTENVGNAELNLKPMGSGPYKFVEWRKGVKVVLERNDTYWRGMPPFASVEFAAVPDAATRLADLRTGKADLIVGLNPDDALQLDGISNVEVRSSPTERVGYFMMNTQAGPLADKRVRQAVSHAIDRQLIIDALLGGYSEVTNQLLTPAHFGYIEGLEWYGYDPEKAKALLTEAGVGNGVEIEIITSPRFDQRIVQAIQQQLSDVGITLNIAMSDMATFLGRRRAEPEGFGDTAFGRWSCACQDADGVLYAMFHSDSVWSKYANPELDKYLEAGRSTLDEVERIAAYTEAHRIIFEEAPSIPLYQAAAIYGANSALSWSPTQNESVFVMDMGWSE
jgi:peptide/nickel transport system substrate-binding protein